MEPGDRERVVNERLDAALKRYGESEPRPGLESRILATLRTEHLPESRWGWRPALAGLAVLLLGAAMFLARGRDVVHETAVGTAIKKETQATREIPPAPVLARVPSHAVKRSSPRKACPRPVNSVAAAGDGAAAGAIPFGPAAQRAGEDAGELCPRLARGGQAGCAGEDGVAGADLARDGETKPRARAFPRVRTIRISEETYDA